MKTQDRGVMATCSPYRPCSSGGLVNPPIQPNSDPNQPYKKVTIRSRGVFWKNLVAGGAENALPLLGKKPPDMLYSVVM